MGRYAYSSPEWEQQDLLPSANMFDVEGENEITRLLLQHRYLSESMGGVLPTSLVLSQVRRVLDVACGAGGWVYELAWNHPSMHVTGIDARSDFVEQAEALIVAKNPDNYDIVQTSRLDLRPFTKQPTGRAVGLRPTVLLLPCLMPLHE